MQSFNRALGAWALSNPMDLIVKNIAFMTMMYHYRFNTQGPNNAPRTTARRVTGA